METILEYRLFGIVVWSVTRKNTVTEEDAVYTRLSERFAREMDGALNRAREARS